MWDIVQKKDLKAGSGRGFAAVQHYVYIAETDTRPLV
jgi:hypothetical protein